MWAASRISKHVASVAFVCATAGLGSATLAADGSGEAASSDGIAWERDIQSALDRSRDEGVPLLVDVYADWCKPCHVMEQTTFSNAEVIEASRRFVALKVDADANDAFATRYGAYILPTTLVLDFAGRELVKSVGLTGPETLIAMMETVEDGYAGYAERIRRPFDARAAEGAAAYLMSIGNPARAAEILKTGLTAARGSGVDPTVADDMELKWAQATMMTGKHREARAAFERLEREAQNPRIRGWALAGVVEIDQRSGRRFDAERARERLLREYPAVAEELGWD